MDARTWIQPLVSAVVVAGIYAFAYAALKKRRPDQPFEPILWAAWALSPFSLGVGLGLLWVDSHRAELPDTYEEADFRRFLAWTIPVYVALSYALGALFLATGPSAAANALGRTVAWILSPGSLGVWCAARLLELALAFLGDPSSPCLLQGRCSFG